MVAQSVQLSPFRKEERLYFPSDSGASVTWRGNTGRRSKLVTGWLPLGQSGSLGAVRCDSMRRLWETEATGDAVRRSQYVGLIHSAEVRRCYFPMAVILGSSNLSDWHIQTLLFSFFFFFRSYEIKVRKRGK